MSETLERPLKCFSSAAAAMKGPPGYFASAAFSNCRWTLAGDQRDDRMRRFCQKFLRRLDSMDMPFYPQLGLMDLKTARHRYVTGVDPWRPAESPYLDGTAVTFAHCLHDDLHPRCWALFAEIGFDVARLAQVPVMWGGFADPRMPGTFRIYDGACDTGWRVDKRTYGVRKGGELPYRLDP